MSKRLFLIDAMAQIYRAHFAMARNPLFTSKGENVSAVFGFTSILLGLIEREKPDLLAVVYDSKEPTFRHHIHAEYKATREKMPEELALQLPRMDEVIDALGLTKVILPGYEADDLVGTLAKQGEEEGYDVFLVTGDKDYYQLVTDKVKFYNIKRGLDNVDLFDPAGVEEVFGVRPERVIDVLALAGDSSDNVPGVPKVGMKTAIKFLKEYDTVEGVLNHHADIGGKIGENLAEFREQAMLSKDLVTIRTEVPIDADVTTMSIGEWKSDRLRDLFLELEFKTFFRYLDVDPQTIDSQSGKVKYTAVTTENSLKKLIKEMEKCSRFAIDTETTSKDPMRATLVGISISINTGKAYYIPVNYFAFPDQLPSDFGHPLEECVETTNRILEMMRPVLEGGPAKIAQHAKYDFMVLKRHGVEVAPLSFDTMLADYLLNPGARAHNLDAMALNYLKIQKIETSELIGTGKNQITMDKVPLDLITKYACEDADVTLRLCQEMEPKVESAGLKDLLEEVEQPISDVLLQMEHNGIKLDVDYLKELSEKHHIRLKEIEKECHELAGTAFNLNSPKQLSHILFEKLNLPTKLAKKTKTGFSTDHSVLEKLAPLDPLPAKLVEHRMLQKLLGTYIDALPQLVHPETGRIHTSYNQAVAATGRLSSNDPNLQNIPIRTEEGSQVRRAFIADEGKVLLSADYSQVELRMMAHLSGDKGMIEDFVAGHDIHRATAAKIFNVAPEEVTKQQRSASKEVNFGVLFGMREFGLSSRLGISRNEAREFIDGYFGAYPRVKKFIDELIERARDEGFVSTILGRRRPMPELHSSNFNIRQQYERMTIATAVQGSAADLIKLAMIQMHRSLKREKLPYKILLQVHDELVMEMDEDKVDDAAAWAKDKMENAMKLSVPLVVESGYGKNWLEAH
ncbi:DNA polymerase I [bacterium]|nr:DNA polymerase I [bacterium]